MSLQRKNKKDLKEACVKQAMSIVDKKGLEHLSLREVARKLGVSHQAPYRHFPSREHLLAEMVRRAYEDFASFLRNREPGENEEDDLRNMGIAYVTYSMKHPLYYRLMFNTSLPNPEAHPEMMKSSQFAFNLLVQGIRQVHAIRFPDQVEERSVKDALFIWFSLHGLCSILESEVIGAISLDKATQASMVDAIFERLSWVMNHDANLQV
ncbi:MAG: TetR/AcrR family transcriptional regulator [Gammaproteobacteria bacterium]|nr:TetR/AcrR family transcriptional regulator [Gammaproteobacteria bacterium]